jgi:hypothetical protein
VLNAEFVDQGRLARGPRQPVEVITWSSHDAEVIDVEGANRVLEKAIRDAGSGFLRTLTLANAGRPEKRGKR